MAELTIREILDLVPRGQIRIPAFQRGFVWDPQMVAFLMDSIYKGYPFGSLLLWRTREQLKHERQLGPFVLPDRDPDYPIDYILDGSSGSLRSSGFFRLISGQIRPLNGPMCFSIYQLTRTRRSRNLSPLGQTRSIRGDTFP